MIASHLACVVDVVDVAIVVGVGDWRNRNRQNAAAAITSRSDSISSNVAVVVVEFAVDTNRRYGSLGSLVRHLLVGATVV